MGETPTTGRQIEIINQSVTVSQPIVPQMNRVTDSERRNRRQNNENLSTPSISAMLNGRNLAGVSESSPSQSSGIEAQNVMPFDQMTLSKFWRDFAETVDAAQLKSALSVREPILGENFSIFYYLDNEVQRQRIILDLKPKLLGYLNKALNNDKITIEFQVSENLEEIKNKPYTDQEKFGVLVEKYPVLALLKQRFGLDFE